jgi:hypothetical protein
MARAFTIVELLVSVTLIVLLLALLAPALDRAIYRSELTLCATNMKAFGTAATMYGANHQRAYPDHAGRAWPYHLSNPFAMMLMPYTALNRNLNCPFSKAMDYEGSVQRNSTGGIIPPYALWFGWRYTGHSVKTRMGRPMTALDHTDTSDPRTVSFSVMASDWDLFYRTGDTRGSHPDYDPAERHNEWRQDSDENPLMPGQNISVAPRTYSFWWGFGAGKVRGLFDMNVGWEDGAVLSFMAVLPRDADDRMAYISPTTDPALNDPVMPMPRP